MFSDSFAKKNYIQIQTDHHMMSSLSRLQSHIEIDQQKIAIKFSRLFC